MAVQSFNPIEFPQRYLSTANTSFALGATNQQIGFVFYAPKNGNISGARIRLGVTTAGQTLIAGLQDVGLADGLPDGTFDQSGFAAVADTDDNVEKAFTFGSARTVTMGNLLSLVVGYAATAGSLIILSTFTNENSSVYVTYASAGTHAKQGGRAPVFFLNYDDGTTPNVTGVVPTVSTFVDYSSASNPDEWGAKFRYPFSVTIRGAYYEGRAGGDCDFVLYDSDGTTVLASASRDKDVNQITTTPPYSGIFATSVTLSANTYYRLSIKPTTATGVRLIYFDCAAASDLDAFLGIGQDFHLTKRTDAGAWTDVTTQRPSIGLLIDGIDTSGGGGGGGGSMGYFT